MAVNVALQNPRNGEIKFIKVGFSWTLFLFSTVLGIPLFARKLYRLAFAMLAINVSAIVFPLMMGRNAAIMSQIMMIVGQIVIMFMLGIKGNEITAKYWLARSWRFTEPQSDAVHYAKMTGRFFDQPFAQPTRETASPSTAP